MPWLHDNTALFVADIDSHCEYPKTLIGNYMAEAQDTHSKSVQAYADMIKARREAEQKAEEDKISEKMQRKAERAARRRAAEVSALRADIEAKFVDKVTPIEEILKQEITDVDGWGQEGKPVVSVLGGFFGQLMIVLNTVAKYYPQLDRPVKTNRSHASRPKSNKSGEDVKSARSGGAASEGAASEAPRMILSAHVVQNFIYTYILEKMKTEKFSMLVDIRFEKFLNSLPNPLQLNEMRTMKPDKQEVLR